MPIALSGPARYGAMKLRSVGFKIETSRHLGLRPTGASEGRAGVRGSVIHQRPNVGSRSASRGRAPNWYSGERMAAMPPALDLYWNNYRIPPSHS